MIFVRNISFYDSLFPNIILFHILVLLLLLYTNFNNIDTILLYLEKYNHQIGTYIVEHPTTHH